jgi:hypothetical protein
MIEVMLMPSMARFVTVTSPLASRSLRCLHTDAFDMPVSFASRSFDGQHLLSASA